MMKNSLGMSLRTQQVNNEELNKYLKELTR